MLLDLPAIIEVEPKEDRMQVFWQLLTESKKGLL